MVPLGEGCFVIAEHLGHPTTVDDGLEQLTVLAAATAAALGISGVEGAPPPLDAIGAHLFATLGFAGDADHYYDVRNSLLPDVLRRRCGIPITLAIVVIEVADRLGVHASGVGMPGHFLVGDGPAPQRWLDPFTGNWLDATGAAGRFRAVHGAAASFDPSFLEPTPHPQILARVLANLAGVERSAGDPCALLRVLELRGDIPGVGGAPRAQVELAEAYVSVGRVGDALAVLEALGERVDPRRREALASRMAVLRAGLN